LRPSGGHRELRSFKVATVIYDATVSLCDRFVSKRSRTHDQTIWAACSGRQNIAEGSRAAPSCPVCGELMVVRTARKGERAGSQFWGCSGYPQCRGARPFTAG